MYKGIFLIDQKAFMWPLSLPRSLLDINRRYFWTSLSLSYKLSHENILWLLSNLKLGNVFENNNYDARLGQCWSWMQWKGMMQGATPALSEIGLSSTALQSLFVICRIPSEVRKRKTECITHNINVKLSCILQHQAWGEASFHKSGRCFQTRLCDTPGTRSKHTEAN